MKKLLAIFVSCIFVSGAWASETSEKPTPVQAGNSAAQEQAQQQSSSSGASSNNAGNNQYIIFNSPEKSISEAKVTYSGTQTLKNVPSVSGPPLTSSNDTCMGSSSGSVNMAGFGASYGSTWTDDNCVMLKNSREMWNMGFRAAALARMCMDELNRDAFDLTELECPQVKRERAKGIVKKDVGSSDHPEITDPIVRQRMGYKPLK